MDQLREQTMINQFIYAAGCDRCTAEKCLIQSNWQFQMALSYYFQEATIPKPTNNLSVLTPMNTPVTPPNFPDALTMFSKMSTMDGMNLATSPQAVSSKGNNLFHAKSGAHCVSSPKRNSSAATLKAFSSSPSAQIFEYAELGNGTGSRTWGPMSQNCQKRTSPSDSGTDSFSTFRTTNNLSSSIDFEESMD
ncbi:hypothetical protein TCAL_01403 [Tigriopus californicus]|uniref:UBA-like domain-containing protein n=1 Tax=Tigriopus californicus TaxID=6832 RepID=A0A553NSC1_TIGCA|nr:UBA-like domain-containing protein 1 [Tigriopus californicus]TRY68336.1 hypothetical protein TCAL_01403 [Tigriopus californicus]